MVNEPRPFSVRDLPAAGVKLRPQQAVALVLSIGRRVANGTISGVPATGGILIHPCGRVTVSGPVSREPTGRVRRLAQLLDGLLCGGDVPRDYRASGALRLLVARGLGQLDLPPYSSIDEFLVALERFGPADEAAALRELHAAGRSGGGATQGGEYPGHAQDARTRPRLEWSGHGEAEARLAESERRLASFLAGRAAAPPPGSGPATRIDPNVAFTVSDMRRARRATRQTLAQIAERTGILLPLLRELEWGHLAAWPAGPRGEAMLTRYARASGQDPARVLAAVRPLLPGAGEERASASRPFVEEDRSQPAAYVPAVSRRWPLGAAMAAAAAFALLIVTGALVGTDLPSGWMAGSGQSGEDAPVLARAGEPEPPADPLPPSSRIDSHAEMPSATASVGLPPAGEPTARPAAGSSAVSGEAPALLPAEGGSPETVAAAEGESSLERVDVQPAPAYPPTFSSTGSAVFLHGDEGDSAPLLRVNAAAGGAVLHVTSIVDDGARNYHVRPSPDGEWIAFDSDRDGERGVYVARRDGTHVRRVSGPGYAAVPNWSPDGTRLTFVRAEASRPAVWNLWLLDVTSGELSRLTSHHDGQPWGGSWFPDGERICYSHEDRLIILDRRDGTRRIYPSPGEGRLARTPAVSPDGSRIAFGVHRDGVWLMDMSDGSMRRILQDPTAEEFTWAPDGRRLAFHSARSGEWGMWIMASR